MYPLAFILGIGIMKKNKDIDSYVLPLSAIGSAIAFYHVLLQEKVIPEALKPCGEGVDCALKRAYLFDTLTIPMLSLIAFLIITVLMLYYRTRIKNKKK